MSITVNSNLLLCDICKDVNLQDQKKQFHHKLSINCGFTPFLNDFNPKNKSNNTIFRTDKLKNIRKKRVPEKIVSQFFRAASSNINQKLFDLFSIICTDKKNVSYIYIVVKQGCISECFLMKSDECKVRSI